MWKVEKFQTKAGKEPFSEWVETLDMVAQAKIYAYIDRVAMGGARKNVKPVGSGVSEITIHYGAELRIYFGLTRNNMILLLGGDKGSQKRDIKKAIEYWRTYESK